MRNVCADLITTGPAMEEAITTGEENQPGSGRVSRYFSGDHAPDEKKVHVPSLPFRKEGRLHSDKFGEL
jgi:hypothetical protein